MGRFHWPWQATDRVELVDLAPAPPPDPAGTLYRIATEAVVLQDRAEDVLAAIGRHEHLGVLAGRGGPLVRRFFALRDELPTDCPDARLARLAATLDTILYHHAMQVATALEFLALEWRSERLAASVTTITGLGAPAALLDEVYAELRDTR